MARAAGGTAVQRRLTGFAPSLWDQTSKLLQRLTLTDRSQHIPASHPLKALGFQRRQVVLLTTTNLHPMWWCHALACVELWNLLFPVLFWDCGTSSGCEGSL